MQKIPIVLASDNNYAKYMAVTVVSILENKAESTFYDFYLLLSPDFTSKSRKIFLRYEKKYKNIKFNFINMKDSFSHLKRMIKHISNVTYYRLKMPEIIPPSLYEKCIYFDTDVAVNSDLSEYYSTDLKDFYIAGVKAPGWVTNEIKTQQATKILGINDCNNYINAGAVIWNLKKIQEDNLCPILYKEADNNYPTVDQDVVNKVFYGKIKTLAPKYNVMTKYSFSDDTLLKCWSKKEVDEAKNAPVIIHYACKDKPWNHRKSPLAHYWWKYAKKSGLYGSFLIDYIILKLRSIIKPNKN